MSQPNNIDQERYFSDSEYRRQIAEESSKRSKSSSRLREAFFAVGITLFLELWSLVLTDFFIPRLAFHRSTRKSGYCNCQ